MSLSIARCGDLKLDLGECPVWEEANQKLWLMDCRQGRIYSMDRDWNASLEAKIEPPTGSFALCADGSLIVSRKETIVRLREGKEEILAQIEESHPNMRLNDGAVMPDGSFVVGTMHVFREPGEEPLGGLYRLSADGRLTRIGRAFGVTNGPKVSPLDGRFYVCDSTPRQIYSYAINEDGSLSDEKLFASTDSLGSAPDGCCFDSEGGLWTALVHAAAIIRFAPDGSVSQRIDLPLAHPASLCFGGPALDELYVTSISDSGRLKAEGPMDGAVLRITGAGYRGLPTPYFGR